MGQVSDEASARMRIGVFAARAGISVDTVRFYERRGILGAAPRTDGGYRTFETNDLERVTLARQLQQLGLTVAEIADALAVHDSDGVSCATERWRLDEVEQRIQSRLTELRRTRDHIRRTLAACDAGSCHLTPRDAPWS